MYRPFFPNPTFAWFFCGVLLLFLVVAAYIDTRKMIIPKWLTLSLLGFGLLLSITRGAWLGIQEDQLWLMQSGNSWYGGVDGFLYALTGFLVGFGMLFVLWILGTCGGGDVKLFAALGAWLGPWFTVLVLAVSLVVLIFAVLIKLLTVGLTPMKKTLEQERSTKKSKKATEPTTPTKPAGFRITYSLPVALATALVLLWVFRFELKLDTPQPQRMVQAHAN